MYKIAIVDDETEILNMLNNFLKKSNNYVVTTYNNPVVAVDSIATGNYDLVLMDIMMPQMDGLTALEKIRERKPQIKAIIMTAHSTLDRVLKSHKIGATDYIMKPFDSLASLESKIKSVLSSN